MTRYPSNCLLAAVLAWCIHPRSVRIRAIRNRAGRLHFIWAREEKRFEFHASGRSRLPYWRNAMYLGSVREIEQP